MKLRRFAVTALVAASIMLFGAGLSLASPYQGQGLQDTSGFVGFKVIKPSCETAPPTFAIVGRYVGEMPTALRLQRLVNIEDGYEEWITVADRGLSILLNGREVDPVDIPSGAPQLTVHERDVFQISHVHETDGSSFTYRVLSTYGNQEEQLKVDRLNVPFPDDCSDTATVGMPTAA